MSSLKKSRLSHRICPHCNKELNIRTYKEHKRLFYDDESHSWFKSGKVQAADDSDDSDIATPPISPEIISHMHDLEESQLNDDEQETIEDSLELMDDMQLPTIPDPLEPCSACPEEFWNESDNELIADIQPSASESQPPDLPNEEQPEQDDIECKAVVWWVVLFISLFQTLHSISDKAITWLLKFIHALLKYCGRYSPTLDRIAQSLPCSLYQRDMYLRHKLYPVTFERYMVCPICHSLYKYDECVVQTGTNIRAKVCPHTEYSKKCTGVMLKEVVTISGNKKLYPHRVFCYHSIITALKIMVSRQRFVELCESTRNVACCADRIYDVYDGKIWKDFLVVNGKDFLSAPFTYAFILNIDWFQPYELSTYSVGVVYLVLLNLPRPVRYKRENILLVGIIPGPTEPSLSINTYLDPLVSELLKLWDGIDVIVPGPPKHAVKIRAALIAVACDIPAGRKVCGFLSHSARLGCSRCFCNFIEDSNEKYSKFKRDQWEMRTNERHRADVIKLEKCKSITQRAKKELEIGCRFSVLLKLPYFDPVRMLLIDPMHNLFLGSAKYFVKSIWIKKELLSTADLDVIYQRVKRMKLHINIGRVPARLDSGTTFTAEQWMNWTIYYSIFCLRGLLSEEHMECWRHFVLACRRLCRNNLSLNDVKIADALLMQFCRRVNRLYGKACITPNMHLHSHLASCVYDYGPCHTFWLFSFERYNGILGNQPTNNRAIEIQLMSRFLKDNMHLDLLHQVDMSLIPLTDIFYECTLQHAKKFGSLSTEISDDVRSSNTFSDPAKYTLTVLSSERMAVLKSVYLLLYPDICDIDTVVIPTTVRKFTYIWMNGVKLSSVSDKAANPYILATPVKAFSGQPDMGPRPAEIQYFIRHSFQVSSASDTIYETRTFAVVTWPLIHPSKDSVGKPVEIWCYNLFENNIDNCFIPLENIVSRIIIAIDTFEEGEVLFVVPVLN